MNPLVSVCIPTYNGAAYLREALDSVKRQTYSAIEVIVSDDASKDGTLALAEAFQAEVDFPVRIVSHKPAGIGANWNNSLKYANGKYVKFLFQDDVLEPTCIAEMVDLFSGRPEFGLVGCKRDFIVEGEKTKKIVDWIAKYGNLQSQFDAGGEITVIDQSLFGRSDFMESPLNKIGEPPTVMFRKEILAEVGYFDEDLEQILDYVFYYRILKKYPIGIINKRLVKFRIHAEQATNVNRERKVDEGGLYRKILYKEFLPLLEPGFKKQLVSKFSRIAHIKRKFRRFFGRFSS